MFKIQSYKLGEVRMHFSVDSNQFISRVYKTAKSYAHTSKQNARSNKFKVLNGAYTKLTLMCARTF